jgi:hypothetical protein
MYYPPPFPRHVPTTSCCMSTCCVLGGGGSHRASCRQLVDQVATSLRESRRLEPELSVAGKPAPTLSYAGPRSTPTQPLASPAHPRRHPHSRSHAPLSRVSMRCAALVVVGRLLYCNAGAWLPCCCHVDVFPVLLLCRHAAVPGQQWSQVAVTAHCPVAAHRPCIPSTLPWLTHPPPQAWTTVLPAEGPVVQVWAHALGPV